MKEIIPKKVLARYYQEARSGYGREKEIAGGNTQVEFTMFASDFTEAGEQPNGFARKHIRITLNKKHMPIGYTVLP